MTRVGSLLLPGNEISIYNKTFGNFSALGLVCALRTGDLNFRARDLSPPVAPGRIPPVPYPTPATHVDTKKLSEAPRAETRLTVYRPATSCFAPLTPALEARVARYGEPVRDTERGVLGGSWP